MSNTNEALVPRNYFERLTFQPRTAVPAYNLNIPKPPPKKPCTNPWAPQNVSENLTDYSGNFFWDAPKYSQDHQYNYRVDFKKKDKDEKEENEGLSSHKKRRRRWDQSDENLGYQVESPNTKNGDPNGECLHNNYYHEHDVAQDLPYDLKKRRMVHSVDGIDENINLLKKHWKNTNRTEYILSKSFETSTESRSNRRLKETIHRLKKLMKKTTNDSIVERNDQKEDRQKLHDSQPSHIDNSSGCYQNYESYVNWASLEHYVHENRRVPTHDYHDYYPHHDQAHHYHTTMEPNLDYFGGYSHNTSHSQNEMPIVQNLGDLLDPVDMDIALSDTESSADVTETASVEETGVQEEQEEEGVDQDMDEMSYLYENNEPEEDPDWNYLYGDKGSSDDEDEDEDIQDMDGRDFSEGVEETQAHPGQIWIAGEGVPGDADQSLDSVEEDWVARRRIPHDFEQTRNFDAATNQPQDARLRHRHVSSPIWVAGEGIPSEEDNQEPDEDDDFDDTDGKFYFHNYDSKTKAISDGKFAKMKAKLKTKHEKLDQEKILRTSADIVKSFESIRRSLEKRRHGPDGIEAMNSAASLMMARVREREEANQNVIQTRSRAKRQKATKN